MITRLFYRCSNIPNCKIIIPVPIHKTKKALRGFNQSEEIVKELSKLTGIQTANLLKKSKNTKSQMSIPNKELRQKNIIDSFEINLTVLHQLEKSLLQQVNCNNNPGGDSEAGVTAIIVDDVITTGSTLDECAKVLKENGITKVIGLVLAQR